LKTQLTTNHLRQFLRHCVLYGWIGLLHAFIVFAFLNRFAFEGLAEFLSMVVLLGVWVFAIVYSFKVSMRFYITPLKYWCEFVLALVGVFVAYAYPYSSLFIYGALVWFMQYQCKNCVSFTRVERCDIHENG